MASLPFYFAPSQLVSVISYEGLEVTSLRKVVMVLEKVLLRKVIGLYLFSSVSQAVPPDPTSLLVLTFTEGQVNASDYISVEG